MKKIVIIGFGVVGRGVAEVLLRRRTELEGKIGKYVLVAVTERDGAFVNENGLDESILNAQIGDFPPGSTLEVLESLDFDVAIEVTPTDIKKGQPGLTHLRECLKSGHHAITSNKGPLVIAYNELQKLADENNVKLMFEATVGGAMPLIKLVRNDLAGNRIYSIRGILNGTCNYILSRMESERLTYNQVLAEAKELGYAEADPTYDVEGIDAAAKVVIAANSLMGMDISYDDVEIEGIKEITTDAFNVAMERGYTIRLIGEISREPKTLKVSPRLIPIHHPLAVTGTLNAVQIRTDLARDVIVMGHGAGKMETASAIISDLVDIFKSDPV